MTPHATAAQLAEGRRVGHRLWVRIMRCFIVVASTLLAACVFEAGDPCADDTCLANEAPLARIRGVDGEGNLRVGARTRVLISAAPSSDPDLDPLTFSWSVAEDCSGSVVGATNAVELQLSDLTAESDCSVTLTVSDGTAEGTTSARLLIRDVGAHVSGAAPCAVAYDATSEAAQGTPELPFCDLRDALRAATDYQLAQVSLASGPPQQVTTDLLIDRGVTVRGGYVRNDGSWDAPAAESRSELALAANARLAVAAPSLSDTVAIENVAIFRSAACTAECVLVDAASTNLALTSVDLGSSPRSGAAVNAGAADAIHYSLRAAGAPDSGRALLSTSAVNIRGALSGLASVGIELTDNVDAIITATTINEESRTATGLRMLGAGDVRIQVSSIDVKSDARTADEARAETSSALGVSDGSSSALELGGCLPGFSATCGGSRSLTLVGTTVSASQARLAVAVAALGTRRLVFSSPGLSTRSTLVASGRQAYGLLSMDLGDRESGQSGMDCNGVTLDVTATASPGLPTSVAAGWSDGYEEPNPDVTSANLGLGSYGAVMNDALIRVRVGSQDVSEAAAVVLRDSHEAELNNVVATVEAADGVLPVNGWSVGRIAGMRLLRTNGVTMTGGTVTIANLAATWIGGGLIDGQMNLANDDIATGLGGANYGSRLLTVANTTFVGPLSVNNTGTVPVRACIGLFGTDSASLQNNTVDCRLGTSEDESSPTMAGVVTLLTRDVLLSDSVIRIGDAVPGSAVRLIGIQDGSRRSSTLGSLGLRATRNVVTIDAPSSLAIGVRLSGKYTAAGQDPDKVTVIDNNVINIKQSSANVGVLAFTTAATLAFNNVRVASCTAPSCSGAFATAFYLMHVARTDPVLLLANGFGVFDQSFGSGDSRATPFAVEHANVSAGLGLSAMRDNVYGIENPSSPAALFVRFEQSSTEDLDLPQNHAAMDEDSINSMVAETAEGNHAEAPLMCSDGIHGDPLGPQVGRVLHVSGADLDVSDLRDIDGESRSFASADAGADVIGVCP